MKELVVREILARVISNKEKFPLKVWVAITPLVKDIQNFSNTISGLDLDKPETWLSAGLEVVESFVDMPRDFSNRAIHDYVSENGYKVLASGVYWIMEMIIEKCELEVIVRAGDLVLCSIKGLDLLICVQESSMAPKTLSVPIERSDEAWAGLQDFIWKDRDCIRVFASKDNEVGISTWKLTDRQYQGELLDTVLEMEGFIKAGIRRVVALQGDPGTGKSTLCASAARVLSKRTVVMENTLLLAMSKDLWDMLIQSLGPTVVIIDDIDRIDSRSLSHCLSYFEDTNYSVPLTLMTTNDQSVLPDAFRRPGRIDAIYEVPSPSEDVRRRIIQEFVDREGLGEVPDEIFAILDRVAMRYPGAYLSEMVKRFKVYGWDYEVVENDLVLRPIWEEVTK